MRELLTEASNPASAKIDSLSTRDVLQVMNDADKMVALSVERELGSVAQAVDSIAARIRAGGRLFYTGAGTSGRLGVLDASECPPTFSTPPDLVQGLIAGGDHALRHPIEGAEDSTEQGMLDLTKHSLSRQDSLVGIAASGRTPYVLGGLAYARQIGALTIGLSCTPNSEVAKACDIAITPVPGPEIITGSTRLRAGTATKMVLNMLSTGVMIRLGYVYGNYMVNVQPTNHKLVKRACGIISDLADVSYDEASALLAESGSVRVAIVMHKLNLTRNEAEARLTEAGGRLRVALGEA